MITQENPGKILLQKSRPEPGEKFPDVYNVVTELTPGLYTGRAIITVAPEATLESPFSNLHNTPGLYI